MSTAGGQGEVTYTVKELLARESALAEARHREMQRTLAGLTNRIDALEDDRLRRKNTEFIATKSLAAIVIAIGILINLPAALYFLHGAGQ